MLRIVRERAAKQRVGLLGIENEEYEVSEFFSLVLSVIRWDDGGGGDGGLVAAPVFDVDFVDIRVNRHRRGSD